MLKHKHGSYVRIAELQGLFHVVTATGYFLSARLTCKTYECNELLRSSCLHGASMIIKHLIVQLMRNIKYVDTIKIIKYLEVLQHVSDHRGSIIREPCTVLG